MIQDGREQGRMHCEAVKILCLDWSQASVSSGPGSWSSPFCLSFFISASGKAGCYILKVLYLKLYQNVKEMGVFLGSSRSFRMPPVGTQAWW